MAQLLDPGARRGPRRRAPRPTRRPRPAPLAPAAAISDGREAAVSLPSMPSAWAQSTTTSRSRATNPSPSSQAVSAAGGTARATASSSRSAAPVSGQQRQRPLGQRAIERHPLHERPPSNPRQRLDRRRLAQQQPQLVAHRAGERRQRPAGDAPHGQRGGLRLHARTPAASRSARAAAAASGRRGTTARAGPAARARRGPRTRAARRRTRPSNATAIALTVKSRRCRSSSSVPGRTSGSAPGRA